MKNLKNKKVEDFFGGKIENENNDIYIKFKRSNFPPLDRVGNVYEIESSDVVRIKGDIESIR